MKPLQKMEFIGSSRQKFQKHRLQNYKQKPPQNATKNEFVITNRRKYGSHAWRRRDLKNIFQFLDENVLTIDGNGAIIQCV